ncbi:hypothetical protein C8F04DRAFT_310503 [Mycena alexandri]|uniref:Uncharacterized protein n=1 Tax=Mycena alexandri TaxID=1745969 RepID=A0AAD6S422_9AGAR|nr:hypothetical protein C8F04DRAFT_310503 [Mycena alexandri]
MTPPLRLAVETSWWSATTMRSCLLPLLFPGAPSPLPPPLHLLPSLRTRIPLPSLRIIPTRFPNPHRRPSLISALLPDLQIPGPLRPAPWVPLPPSPRVYSAPTSHPGCCLQRPRQPPFPRPLRCLLLWLLPPPPWPFPTLRLCLRFLPLCHL